MQQRSLRSVQSRAAISGNPFTNGPRADACGFSDGLRPLPNLNLPYNSLSTVRRQTGILVHVHPVLPWNLKSQQPQLPRSEPDGQPTESSHLAVAIVAWGFPHFDLGRRAAARPLDLNHFIRRETCPDVGA